MVLLKLSVLLYQFPQTRKEVVLCSCGPLAGEHPSLKGFVSVGLWSYIKIVCKIFILRCGPVVLLKLSVLL